MLTIRPTYRLFKLLEAGKLTRTEFEDRALRFTAKADQLENRTAREVKRLLRGVDREIRDNVVKANDAETLSRGDINSVIDRAVDKFTDDRRRVMQRATQDAVDLAGDFRRKINAIADVPTAITAIPPKIAQDLVTVQDDANKAFGDDLRNRLKLEVMQGVADGKTPRQIVADMVSKRIVTPSRIEGDPQAHGALAKAEMLAKSNLRQVFNAAGFAQAKGEGVPGMMKIWITQKDKAVREAHRAAGRDYAIGGRIGPIPITQNFIVGDEPLMFPGDPKGSPENIYNCRCVSVEIAPEVEEEVNPAGGQFK